MSTTNTERVVKLETPIKRGDTEITEVTLRKPLAGALRGLNLRDLVNCDATAVMELLPRITTPSLIKAEIDKMDPVDLGNCAGEVVYFLAPRQVREQFDQQ